ncbi:Glutamyl-tRNA(Gln) amidotransferase subunit A [Hordeum vulgare]|nr:Glutamyl-tRNA(Gln) amidotransferase subunit A [Hordeum vulgare]
MPGPTCEQAHAVAPPSHLITEQDREEHRWQQRRLLIAEADERAMAEWRQRYPQDVANENAFWAEWTARRRAEQAAMRRWKALAISQCDLVNAGWESFFDSDDPRWEDAFLDTSNDTNENDDSK